MVSIGLDTTTITGFLEYSKIFENPNDASEKASAICILTEWEEFTAIDWELIYSRMKRPAWIFDGRNILNREILKNMGFDIYQIGK